MTAQYLGYAVVGDSLYTQIKMRVHLIELISKFLSSKIMNNLDINK